ncbi:MAG: acyl carrier protein [Magnetococcales bacterium]|nr:acyl carrier protein [Magnetococcales bacterium]MBF0439451.1 acyl carrier protein [Magnetococcales bacterium]
MDTTNKIKSFLTKFVRDADVGDDEDLFATGLVTSLFAMHLVLFLEKEFQVKVDNKDLDFDNFRTINAIVSLIEKKRNSV